MHVYDYMLSMNSTLTASLDLFFLNPWCTIISMGIFVTCNIMVILIKNNLVESKTKISE